MTPFRTRRRSRPLSFVALLVAANVLAFAATAQAQGLGGPRIAEFDPSPDHWAFLDNNEPAVSRYEFGIYLLGVSEPVQTVDIGKPSPDPDGRIRYDLSQAVTWSLSPGVYQARVSAIGPHGTAPSEPSDPFTLEENLSTCTFSLSVTALSAPASGGGYAVGVLTGDGCGWVVTTEVPWVRLWTGGGSGSGKAAFDVRANTSPSSRTATIEMGGQNFTIWQDGAIVPVLSWATPAPIAQGTPLSAVQLNATADVPGTFVYSPEAGTVLPAGTHTLTATLIMPDRKPHAADRVQTTLVVNVPDTNLPGLTTPQITWPVPAPITEGTALTGTQLNAGASVAGTFSYNPPAGMVLPAGVHTLSVVFTPADTVNYATATASTILTVTAAPPPITEVRVSSTSTSTAATSVTRTTAESASPMPESTPESPAPSDLRLNAGEMTSLAVNPQTFLVTVERPKGGTIWAAGITCGTGGSDCAEVLPAGVWLGLRATPDAGYVFASWTGDCSGTTPDYALTVISTRRCGAVFTATSGLGQ